MTGPFRDPARLRYAGPRNQGRANARYGGSEQTQVAIDAAREHQAGGDSGPQEAAASLVLIDKRRVDNSRIQNGCSGHVHSKLAGQPT
jgi:hypothetical protein